MMPDLLLSKSFYVIFYPAAGAELFLFELYIFMIYNGLALGNWCEDSKPLRETPTLVGGLRYI